MEEFAFGYDDDMLGDVVSGNRKKKLKFLSFKDVSRSHHSFYKTQDPRPPLMILECDGTNVMMINISPQMINQSETVEVADGADCSIMVRNITSGKNLT